MNPIDKYNNIVGNYMGSDSFLSLDDNERQRNLDLLRLNYIDQNPDVNVDDINTITEEKNKEYLRGTGRGRYTPEPEDLNNIIFPNQEEGYESLSKDQKNEKIEEFKLAIPELAAMHPAQKEDMEYFLKQSARELERRANGEGRWKPTDLAVRYTQGAIAGAARYIGAESAAESIEDFFHENAEFDEDFTSHLAQGFGDVTAGMAIFAVTAATTRGLGGTAAAGMRAGTGASAITNGIMRYNEAYKQAIDLGLDANKAETAGISALPAAIVDVFGDRIIASKLFSSKTDKIFNAGSLAEKKKELLSVFKDSSNRSKLLEIGRASLAEGSTEVIGDYIASYRPYLTHGYDDFIPTDDELKTAFAVGAIIGGGITTATSRPGLRSIPGRVETTTTEAGQISTTPRYGNRREMQLGETARVIDKLDPSKQNEVYDLLAKGRYKEAHQLSETMFDEISTSQESAATIQPSATDIEVETVDQSTQTNETATQARTEPSVVSPQEELANEISLAKSIVFEGAETDTDNDARNQRINSVAPNRATLHNQIDNINLGENETVLIPNKWNQNAKILIDSLAVKWKEKNPENNINDFYEKININSPNPEIEIPALPELFDILKSSGVIDESLTPEEQSNFLAPLGIDSFGKINFAEAVDMPELRQSLDAIKSIALSPIPTSQPAPMAPATPAAAAASTPVKPPKKPSRTAQTAAQILEDIKREVRTKFAGRVEPKLQSALDFGPAVDFLQAIANDNPQHAPAINRMMADLTAKNPGVTIRVDPMFPTGGQYDGDTNSITIKNTNMIPLSHEVAHALTQMDIRVHVENRPGHYKKKLADAKKDPNTPEHIKVLIDAYQRAAVVLGRESVIGQDTQDIDKINAMPREVYAFINLHEFAAEAMSTAEFQEELSNIPYKGRNLWKVIVDAIANAMDWMSSIANPELIMRSKNKNALAVTLGAINQMIYTQTTVNEQAKAALGRTFLTHTTPGERRMAQEGRAMLNERWGPEAEVRQDLVTFEDGEPVENNINYLPGAKFSSQSDLALAGKSGPFKALTPNKEGTVPWQNLQAKFKNYPKAEVSMITDVLSPMVEGGRINLNDAISTLEMLAGSAVNVVRLSAIDTATENQKRIAEIEHIFDTRYPLWRENEIGYIPIDEDGQALKKELEERISNNISNRLNTNVSEAASARFTNVNPKPLSQMEDARDITVEEPVGSNEVSENERAELLELIRSDELTEDQKRRRSFLKDKYAGVPKFREHTHFPTRKNVIGFGRMYDETLPTGEKVTFVFEVQSDWASNVRSADQRADGIRLEERDGSWWLYQPYLSNEPLQYDSKESAERAFVSAKRQAFGIKGVSPFLSVYENLVLKSAIHDALDKGQNHIAITDAETAMMTEQHDRLYYDSRLALKILGLGKAHDIIRNLNLTNHVEISEGRINENSKMEVTLYLKNSAPPEIITIAKKNGFIIPEPPKPPQEAGMRAAYDAKDGRLHNIMRKLTKSKGEYVDFGEHQNAEGVKGYQIIGPDGSIIRDNITGIIEANEFALSVGGTTKRIPIGSSVFKNPDGTPKSNITAIVYPLDKVDKEEISSLFSRSGSVNNINYSPETARKITERQDRLYMETVESANFTLAQEMVDLAARRAGYDVDQVLYRGDRTDWYLVDRPLYLSKDMKIAWEYADADDEGRTPRKFYIKDNLRLARPGMVINNKLIKTSSYVNQFGHQFSPWDAGRNIDRLTKFDLLTNGYDGIEGVVDGTSDIHEVVLLDGAHMKLADPVTFDVYGAVVPLSQRFDTQKNMINYSPDNTRAQRIANSYKRYNSIVKGKINDKSDIRTHKMMEILGQIRISDVPRMEPEMQEYFFAIVDNIYEARKNAVSNPQARIDSDTVIAELEDLKTLINSYAINDMIAKYDELIAFDSLGIDITDRETVMNVINDYHEKLGVVDKVVSQKLEKIYAKYRARFNEIRDNVVERFADSENYTKEIESIYGAAIHDVNLREVIKAHFAHITSVDVSGMKGVELYRYFYAVNNMHDNNFKDMSLTADFIGRERNKNEKVADFANLFRDPFIDSNRLLNGVDTLNKLAELQQVQGDRLSRFERGKDFIRNKLMGPLRKAINIDSFNRKRKMIDSWIGEKKKFEDKIGRKMNSEDRIIMAMTGRMIQYHAGQNPDSELKKNIEKERKSLNNKINHGAIADRKRFKSVVLPMFERMVKDATTMSDFMENLPARMMGDSDIATGQARLDLLNKAQEIFSEFDLESRIISEGFHGVPFRKVVNYITNDVMTDDTGDSDYEITDPLSKWGYQTQKVGLKNKAGHLNVRQDHLGEQDYYSYNIENTLDRNIERIAVDNSTVAERFILASRLKQGSELNNIISLDENGVSHPGRIEFVKTLATNLVNNAISRGEPMHILVGGLRSMTNAFARVTLSGLHHIVMQPISALSDYAVRTGNIKGWFEAAAFYATHGSQIDEWFKEHARWVYERGALEAMALDVRRSPMDNSALMDNPGMQFLESVYEGATNVITYSIRKGDNFASKITLLAEYTRLLKQKGYKMDSIQDFDFETSEGMILSEAISNVERNVNTSNKIERGELYSDRRQNMTIARNMLIAFASHQSSLATQLNMAIRDIKELHGMGATKGELEAKIRTIGAILTQSFVFTSGRYMIGAMTMAMMVSLIKDLFDDEEGTIADLQEKVYVEEKKGDPVRIANARHELDLAKTTRTVVEKMRLRSVSTDSWFKQSIRDMMGSAFIGFSSGAVEQLNPIFFIADGFGQKITKESNDEIVKDYAERIRAAKEAGRLKEAALLTEKKVTIEAAEYIPFVYADVGGVELGGLYGPTLGAIKRHATEFRGATLGTQEVNYNDFLLAASVFGLGQSEIRRFLNGIDNIENKQWQKRNTFNESLLPDAELRARKAEQKRIQQILRSL